MKKKYPFLILFILLQFQVSLSAETTIAVKDILQPDGTLMTTYDMDGTLNFSGFNIVLDSCRGPVFTPALVTPGWNALGTGLSSTVVVITISGNDVYMGGNFVNAGGNTDADFITRWDGSTWNALGSGLSTTVIAIAVSGSDVYAGGSFVNAGGDPNADRIARWDGSTWNALGSGLNNAVLTLVLNGSDILVGGVFTDAGGNANADYIARWNGSAWNTFGSILNSFVRTIVINGSNIYVGGNFTDAGGNANADNIARWDGSTWNALGPGLDNTVRTIAISGSNVYAGGTFLDAGGNPNADRIARWNGSTWNALGTGISGVGTITVFAIVINGSDVYVGGDFLDAGGNPDGDLIARWDGSTWNALGAGLFGASVPVVSAIAIDGNDVYAGGYFTDAGGNANADNIARWENTPAPVELLTFSAASELKQVQLYWRTASESNNRGFGVQRSADGQYWTTLGFEAGHGNTLAEHPYTFLDQQPLPGRSYYRLEQMDYDGASEYSPIVQVTRSRSKVLVSPNPVSGNQISLLFDEDMAEQAITLHLYSATGQLLHTAIYTGSMRQILDIDDLPRGVYTLEIYSDGVYAVERLVVER